MGLDIFACKIINKFAHSINTHMRDNNCVYFVFNIG